MTSRNDGREDYREKQNWMVQYKSSAIFKDKLDTLQDPNWDLDNLEQIENKFKEYTDEYAEIIQDKTVYQKRRQGKLNMLPSRNQNSHQHHSNQHHQSISQNKKSVQHNISKYDHSQQDKHKDNILEFCQNFHNQLQNNNDMNSSKSMGSSYGKFKRMFSKGKSTIKIKRQRSNSSSLDSSRNDSVDSVLLQKIKDVTERLQHKSYKQYKIHQEKHNKKPPNYHDEQLKEEKITKSYQWQNIHDKIKDEILQYGQQTNRKQTYKSSSSLQQQQQQQQHEAQKLQQQQSQIRDKNRSRHQTYRQQQQNNKVKFKLDQTNPATDLLGTHAISVLFQAMLVNQMKDTFNININIDSGIPISKKVFDVFGIQQSFLTTLKTEGERREYIMKTMNARIDMLMKDWNAEVKQRDKKHQQEEKEKKTQQDKQEQEEQDYFDWLEIKSKHTQLRKKLRAQVIQKMNEFSNQSKLLNVYKQQLQQSKKPVNPQHLAKIMLQGIDYINTKTLIKRMSPQEGSILDKLYNKHKKTNINCKEDYQQSQQCKTEPTSNEIEVNNNYQSQFIEDDDSQDSNIIQWNNTLEKQYQQNKKQAKQVYFADIPTSDWSELGYLPLVQKFNLDSKKQISRDNMLNKYANGEKLTAQELKFIADTSQLLNKCLDKNFLQQSLKNVDQESLHYLELNIAEQIISNYTSMKKTIKEARTQFVKEKVKVTKQENRQASKIAQKYMQKQEYIQWHRKQANLMQHEINRVENKRPILFKYQTNFFFRIFVNIIKDKVKEYRKKKEIENEELKKQGIVLGDYKYEQDLMVSALEKSEKQRMTMHKLSQQKVIEENSKQTMATIHRIHPPSKLPLFPRSDEGETEQQKYERLKDRYEYMDKKIEEFKLGTRSHSEARVPQQFATYYSNGPIQSKPSYINGNKNYKPLSQEELNKIEKVQKTFKKYKMRNVVTRMRDKHYTQGQREHYENLNALYKAKFIAGAIQVNKSQLEQTNLNMSKNSHMQKSMHSSKSQKSYQSSQQSQTSQTQQNINNYQLKLNKFQRKYSQQLLQQQQQVTSKSTFSRTTNKNPTVNITQSTAYYNDRCQTQETQDRLLTDMEQGLVSVSPIRKEKVKKIGKEGNYIDNNRYINLDTRDSIQGQSEVDMSRLSTQQNNFFTPYKGSSNKFSGINRTQTAGSKLERKLQDLMQEQEKKQKLAINPKKQEINFGNAGFMISQLKIKYQTLLQAAKRKQFNVIQNGKYDFSKDDLKQLDPSGCSALYYSVCNNDIPFVEWILKKGGDPNQRCMNDVTPLHIAFQRDFIDCIGLLIAYGGDLNILSAEGITPPGMAKEHTLKLLNLEDAVIVSKSKDMFGDKGEYFDNNKLLQTNPNDDIKEDRVKLSNFFPLQKNIQRKSDVPTIYQQNYTSM